MGEVAVEVRHMPAVEAAAVEVVAGKRMVDPKQEEEAAAVVEPAYSLRLLEVEDTLLRKV